MSNLSASFIRPARLEPDDLPRLLAQTPLWVAAGLAWLLASGGLLAAFWSSIPLRLASPDEGQLRFAV